MQRKDGFIVRIKIKDEHGNERGAPHVDLFEIQRDEFVHAQSELGQQGENCERPISLGGNRCFGGFGEHPANLEDREHRRIPRSFAGEGNPIGRIGRPTEIAPRESGECTQCRELLIPGRG